MNTHAPDPRSRNAWFDEASVAAYFTGYAKALGDSLLALDFSTVEQAIDIVRATAAAGGTLYSAGNGGSAAIADHLGCDFSKGTQRAGAPTLRVQSLVGNLSLTSAISNDIGYDAVFSEQLRMFARPGDALMVISSSGNSANIVEAIRMAKEKGVPTIALTGFSGGTAKAEADAAVHVDFANYGIVEDAHQAVMHAMSQYFYVTR